MAGPATKVLLDDLTSDWERLKKQKSRHTGGIESRVIQNLCFANGEQYIKYNNRAITLETRDDKNKLYLMFNMIGPRMNKLLGRLSAVAPPFKANPTRQDPKSYAKAEVVDRLTASLDKKLIQSSRNWELLYWMMVGGVAFEHVPWIPNASLEPAPVMGPGGELTFKFTADDSIVPQSQMQQMIAQGAPTEAFELNEEAQPQGEVGSEVLGPLNVFVDNSVRSIADLAPDQRVYIAKLRTMGWIEENFGHPIDADKDYSIVSTHFNQPQEESVGGTFLRDLLPLIQGSNDEADMPMAVVVESYAPPSKTNPHGRWECFAPGKEILESQECPYDEIPIVDFHWKPVTTTFWTGDYVSDLLAPQKFINKRLSQLGEQSNATIYSPILMGPGLDEKDIPADYPGTVKNGLSDSGVPMLNRLAPPEFPAWFMPSIELIVKMFNDIAGGADLFQESKFPGQLRGPMAVPMLQEILDTEWGPLFNHLAERLGRVKQMRVNRVKQFYPPSRTMHYTDRNQKDEVMEFHTDDILRSDVDFDIIIEPGSLLPELRALREARLIERLSGPLSILYLDERTGRIDKSKIAADLQFGDVGREGREAQYRKLGMELVEMLWQGKPVPPVLPFYDHGAMMDELEAAMATTEYLRASQPTQQAFAMRWEQHRQFLMQEAAAQQQALQSGAIQSAVAQATQQAAAMAAADAVHAANDQVKAQKEQPTGAYVEQANSQQNRQPSPAQPQPPGKKRTLTVKEEG